MINPKVYKKLREIEEFLVSKGVAVNWSQFGLLEEMSDEELEEKIAYINKQYEFYSSLQEFGRSDRLIESLRKDLEKKYPAHTYFKKS